MQIKELFFDESQNGNEYALIWVDDMELTSEPIMIFQDANVDYLFSKKDVGDEINVVKNGKWWNLIPNPEDKPNFNKLRNNRKKTIKRLKNDSRTEITQELALEFILSEFKTIDFVSDAIDNYVLVNESDIAKEDMIHIKNRIAATLGRQFKLYQAPDVKEEVTTEKKTKTKK